MDIALLSPASHEFFLRWFHYLAGVAWIGLLYYFNFVQGSFFKETDANTKTAATQKLVPRALWWFRWAALVTFLTGAGIIVKRGIDSEWQILSSSWGVLILTGAAMGTIMFLNVWLIIWPNQKIVIAAANGQSIGNAAEAGAKALLASRTNTLFSIPLLFFMGAASHLPLQIAETANMNILVGVLAVIIGGLELNALKGKLGPLTSVSGVISCGFALTAILYALIEVIL